MPINKKVDRRERNREVRINDDRLCYIIYFILKSPFNFVPSGKNTSKIFHNILIIVDSIMCSYYKCSGHCVCHSPGDITTKGLNM